MLVGSFSIGAQVTDILLVNRLRFANLVDVIMIMWIMGYQPLVATKSIREQEKSIPNIWSTCGRKKIGMYDDDDDDEEELGWNWVRDSPSGILEHLFSTLN